jgi:hypothetical protein
VEEKVSENQKKATLYHGSSKVIKEPKFGLGSNYNDYGQGFYLTKNKGLAGEWAVLYTGIDGYINEYQLYYDGLSILSLQTKDVDIWAAVLMANRNGEYIYTTQEKIARFIQEHFIDISAFDIIEGWRADDSYFSYASDYVLGNISKDELLSAMHFGNLGYQTCLKTKKAFSQIKYVGKYPAPADKYYESAARKDAQARSAYRSLILKKK